MRVRVNLEMVRLTPELTRAPCTYQLRVPASRAPPHVLAAQGSLASGPAVSLALALALTRALARALSRALSRALTMAPQVIDLIAILPYYVDLILTAARVQVSVEALQLLRVVRLRVRARARARVRVQG